MTSGDHERQTSSAGRSWRRAAIGALGVVIGGVFLWLALRHIDRSDLERALREMQGKWLLAGVAVYLAAIGLRCLRWGILLRATGTVKWRHAAEALVTGFAANYVLPGRVGELFRADYARRVFNMSRFTALGTIVVERVCDGVVLVSALWIGFAWILFARSAAPEKAWVLLVGAAASILFGAALIFILLSQRIDLRRFGVMESIATRWDRLIEGVASVLRGHATIVALCSIGVWILEVLALDQRGAEFRRQPVAAREPAAARSGIAQHIGADRARLCRHLTNWCSRTSSACSAISKRPESSPRPRCRFSASAR